MLVTDSDTDSPEITALEEHGEVTIGNVTVTFEKRMSSRIVIGVFEKDADTSWLGEICDADNHSELVLHGAIVSDTIDSFVPALAKSTLVAGLDVTICAVGAGCAQVSALAAAFADPLLVVFDPPVGTSTDGEGYAFYDPFISSLSASGLCDLKCFASNGSSLSALSRMTLSQSVISAALRGELEPAFFYAEYRARKNFRFYRLGMEAALTARGKTERIAAFRNLFRERRIAGTGADKFDQLQARADRSRPDRPGAWARMRPATEWPTAGGNVWMLQHDGGQMRYMSDRWQGVPMGYIERDGITLAETPPKALAFLGFGDGLQVERPLARRFPWHVTDENLDGTQPLFGPMAEATLASELDHAAHRCLRSILAISACQPGVTLDEAVRGSPRYDDLLTQVARGRENLSQWNKTLCVDRVRLSLLTGAQQTLETEAAAHYADVGRALSDDLVKMTGQDRPPVIVVVPAAGGRLDGRSEIALAESRFDIDALSLDIVVPTPAYPWPLMSDTQSTPSLEAALVMDELCMLAVNERQQGRVWHCPAIQLASVRDRTVTVQVSTMDGLVLEDGPHGFHLWGDSDAPAVISVDVIDDTRLRIELEQPVTKNGLELAYAWGHQRAKADDDRSANHGALRDKWQHRSWAVPGKMLRRFALPARVPLRLES